MDEQYIRLFDALLFLIPISLIILTLLAGFVGILGILKAIKIQRMRESSYLDMDSNFIDLKDKAQKELKKN